MKKISNKTKLAIFFVIFGMIFTGMIYAVNESGKINLSKTATKVYEKVSNDNLEYGRYAKVNLDVTANSYTESTSINGKLDIVIVFDGSGSMKDNHRLEDAKQAARDFTNTLMDDTGNVQIGFAEYGTNLKDSLNLTTNKNTVLNFINTKLDADGGTNLQIGIAKANELMEQGGRDDAKKIVIVLTDGVPTFFNYKGNRYGTGNNNNAVCVERSSFGFCNKSMKPSEAAKNELDSLKGKYDKADVYTITFGNEYEAASILKSINPENDDPLYKNYKALSGEDLKEKFEEIIELSKNVIGKNAVVKDVIPNTFKLTEESKQELIKNGITIEEKQDGTTELIWTIGNIEADKIKSLTYEVKAKDNYHGSMYTNKSAVLTTTVENENPYYQEENLSLEFEKPAVEIPSITNDDHYNNNESYVGYESQTINGTSILNNDLNKNKMQESTNPDSNIQVEDKIIIVENENTIKNSDGTYSIYKNTIKQGILAVNNDGTFSFISNEKISGEVSFDYYIKTSINPNNETENVYSNTSTVTLKIISRSITEVEGEKIWDDNNNQDGIRPNEITVELYANDKKISEKKINENNWTYNFNNLYVYEKGHENDENYKIKYTIKEKEKITGYTTTYPKDSYDVVNSHTPEKVKISGLKTWNDNNNQDGIRPNEITILLKANGKIVEQKVVSEKDRWAYEFNNLDKFNAGKEIVYTIDEIAVPGYDKNIKENNITNTHTPEKINITGEKKWVDSNNQDGLRPNEITIVLKANGEIVERKVVTSQDNWTYTFTNLDKYSNGEKITYTVDEIVDNNTAKNYTKSFDENNKFIIVNTHNPKNITIKGTKTWKDENNKYERPTEITVNLYANGEKVNSKIVKEIDNWSYEFTNLPEYKDGKLINYTIGEDSVLDYDTKIENYNITNTYNPVTIDILGTKTWDDKENQDGIRPNEITIVLYDHLNNEIAETTASEQTKWTYKFENMPKYANGQEITYTIKEKTVEGYETIINDYNITNIHTPEKISYKVTKQWNDNNNQDGIRPNEITVKLYKNDVLYKTQKITSSNNWTYTFENLPKYLNGKPVEYKIVEDEIKGYTLNIKDSIQASNENNNMASTTLINTHETETTNIEINKIWNDNNNKTNKRPDFVKVNIFADGNFLKQITITKDMNWTHKEILDKYKNGKKIIYTIEEVGIKDYITNYDGYNIINILKYQKSEKKETTLIKKITDTEITPPYTGINENNENNIVAILVIAISSLLVIPTRKVLFD